jgi:hypothetical protein
MKNRGNTHAVSEVIGEVILLAIAVTFISVLYVQVVSTPGPVEPSNVTIVARIEQGCPVFELQRGRPLGPDTKISITLAGFDQMEFLQGELSNHEWTIGERLVVPVDDIYGVKVEATIIDADTNSIVFYGVLQKGFTTRYKGGIWHFDEDLWRRAFPDDVKDSSMNNNHGTSYGRAKIINGTLQPQDVMSKNSGYFNGFMDSVRIRSSWTLNITRAITIEAWMKPQIPEFVTDIGAISGTFGYTPYIIHAFDNVYVYISEEQQKKTHACTVEIIPEEGTITNLADLLLPETSTGSNICQPKIIQMSNHIFLVAFTDWYYRLHLQTLSISPDGSITAIDKFPFPEECSRNRRNSPSLQKITDSLCAIAYWTPTNGGIIRTVEVSSTGKITYTGNTIEYDPASSGTEPREPYLLHAIGSTYVLAYRGPLNRGILKTFTITSTGDITYTGNMVEFDTTGYEPSLVKVSEKVFAVAYRSTNDFGVVKTFYVLYDGSILLTGETKVFENSVDRCFNPWIIHGEDNLYIIAYSTKNNAKGFVVSLEIDKNGLISPMIGFKKQFLVTGSNPEVCYYPIIIHVDEQLYSISFTGGVAHSGYLITILLGPHGRGIYKQNSYLLYANTTAVEGLINNMYVSYDDSSFGLGWNHFALTYDGTVIRLYVNGNIVNETSYPNQRIKLTNAPVYLGRFYCGFMDEVAIYDKALTQEQIISHYMNPGEFEYFYSYSVLD